MSVLCWLGLHRRYKVRWIYDRFSGDFDMVIFGCQRGSCTWRKKWRKA